MTGTPHSNDEDSGWQVWLVAITSLTGLLAAFVIAILRLGKPQGERLAPVPSSIPSGTDKYARLSQSRPAVPMAQTATASAMPARDVTQASANMAAPHGQAATPAVAPQPVSTRWSLATKYLVGVGIFLSLLFLVYISRGSLSLVIFAALIAFVVRPAIGFLTRRFKIKRGMATLTIYILVLVLLVILPLLLIPPIVNGINFVLNLDYQAAAQNLSAWFETASAQVHGVPVVGQVFGPVLDSFALALENLTTTGMPEPVAQVTVNNLADQLAKTLGLLVGVLGPLVSGALSFVFMLLISLHMSLSVEAIQETYPRLIPKVYREEISGLIERIIGVWSAFLRGQLTLMLVMGVLVFLLNWLLGTPYPLFLGFLAGLLEIIPSLGPFLATIPAILLALMSGSTHFAIEPWAFTLIVIAGYLLLSGLENQLIVPKILGEAVSLPPLVVILGVVIGGALFGILGVFLSTPVISTGKEIYSYLFDKILEPEPVEKPPEDKPDLMESIRKFAGRLRLPGRRQAKPAEIRPEGQTN